MKKIINKKFGDPSRKGYTKIVFKNNKVEEEETISL